MSDVSTSVKEVAYVFDACGLDAHASYSQLAGYKNRDPVLCARANLRACLETEPYGCHCLAREYERGNDGFRKDRTLAEVLSKTGDAFAEECHRMK